ncbi:hypothetical protein ABE096_12445 [Robertmurraya massiliosenegalensis]|uniref:hypothetical protein n=1 Tax=Robertmurraya TaxID=2837507 RepID=UPI0039A6DE17
MEGSNLVDLTGITLPFTVNDMVTAGMALLGVVGAFVLLGLAFRFVPKIITVIFSAFRSGSGGRA